MLRLKSAEVCWHLFFSFLETPSRIVGSLYTVYKWDFFCSSWGWYCLDRAQELLWPPGATFWGTGPVSGYASSNFVSSSLPKYFYIAGTPPFSADLPYPPPAVFLTPACTTALQCLILNHWYFISMCLISLWCNSMPQISSLADCTTGEAEVLAHGHLLRLSDTACIQACMFSASVSKCLEVVRLKVY